MFSLFKKKKAPFYVRVKEFESDCYVAGVQFMTDRRSMQKDVKKLYSEFYEKRDNLKDRSDPSGTMVITGKTNADGKFSYFVGDLVDTKEQEDLTVITLEAGSYAYVTVDFKSESDLYFAVAKAKAYFYEKWLPASGWVLRDRFDSIELYDRRSNIKLASVDLVFPLQ